jgi:GNAT superfamily N-acetyltransferase
VREADGKNALTRMILRDLHEEVFGDSAPQVVTEEGWWWLAWSGKTPVGFAGLRLAAATPGTAYLNRSGVLLAHRGHGLQQRFIRLRERKAIKLGLNRMISDTSANNPSANSLIREGYQLFDPDWKWAFGYSLYWQKALTIDGRADCRVSS